MKKISFLRNWWLNGWFDDPPRVEARLPGPRIRNKYEELMGKRQDKVVGSTSEIESGREAVLECEVLMTIKSQEKGEEEEMWEQRHWVGFSSELSWARPHAPVTAVSSQKIICSVWFDFFFFNKAMFCFAENQESIYLHGKKGKPTSTWPVWWLRWLPTQHLLAPFPSLFQTGRCFASESHQQDPEEGNPIHSSKRDSGLSKPTMALPSPGIVLGLCMWTSFGL